MTERSLQRLYEDPATTLSSGLERAQMQATMLAAIASSSPRPLVVVDVGCGDGMATAVAKARCDETPGTDVTIIGLDWSCAALIARGDAASPWLVRQWTASAYLWLTAA